jgi:hypothetical protein
MEFDERWQAIRRGWCLGDDGFRAEMESRVDARISGYNRYSYLGEEARRHDEREAGRFLHMGLELVGTTLEELPVLRKNDHRKKVVAWLIRRNTSVANKWICENLCMGHASNLARHVKDVEESTDQVVVKLREMTKKAF